MMVIHIFKYIFKFVINQGSFHVPHVSYTLVVILKVIITPALNNKVTSLLSCDSILE